MKIIKYLYLFILILFSSGCIITNTPGFFSGYSELYVDDKQKISFISDGQSICKLNNDKKIYSITASHLLDCLKKNDTSVVYFWSPNCKTTNCISLNAAQDYCNENNYNLYVITEYYNMEITAIQNNTKYPIFSINHLYYGTDYCQWYVNRFKKDLNKNNFLPKEVRANRFYFFKNDNLIRTQIFLFDI